MKIEVKFNLWFVLSVLVLAFFLIGFTILSTRLIIIQGEIREDELRLIQSHINWIYKCDKYESNLWQCFNPTLNITGHYCNGTLVCQNEYKVRE